MARWVHAKPELAGLDLTHPTPLGAEVLGDLLSDAIVSGFERWEAAAAAAPLAPALAAKAPRAPLHHP
jgi:hypothetical protein